MSKTALIIGATGLTGRLLLDSLLEDSSYSFVKVFVRSDIPVLHHKLQQFQIDFETVPEYLPLFKADVLFICLGTTIKKAGSYDMFHKIDFGIPKDFIDAALIHGTKQVALISSVGANANSQNYYTKTKGELENYLLSLGIEKTYILRPSMLRGKRVDFRVIEKLGLIFMRLFEFVMLGAVKKYRSIKAEKVISVMHLLVRRESKSVCLESDEIQVFR